MPPYSAIFRDNTVGKQQKVCGLGSNPSYTLSLVSQLGLSYLILYSIPKSFPLFIIIIFFFFFFFLGGGGWG